MCGVMPSTFGPYGDPLARTPHIDSLARDGIIFDRAYTQPVCAPSRSTIITGRYASAMGTQHMRSDQPLPEGVRFFPELLREAGYFCTNNAKTDYNTRTSWDHAWDENGKTAHWRHREEVITHPPQPVLCVMALDALTRLDREIPTSLAPTLGQLAGSSEIGGMGSGFSYDFFLSRLSRHLLKFYGYHGLFRNLQQEQRAEAHEE